MHMAFRVEELTFNQNDDKNNLTYMTTRVNASGASMISVMVNGLPITSVWY